MPNRSYLILTILPALVVFITTPLQIFFVDLTKPATELVGNIISMAAVAFVGGIASGIGIWAWFEAKVRCSGNRKQPATDTHSAVSARVLGFSKWCLVPCVTDMGGIAIAMTASRVLLTRAKMLLTHLEGYTTEWDNETKKGDASVTYMFLNQINPVIIKTQFEFDEHTADIIRVNTDLRGFNERLKRIAADLKDRVKDPLNLIKDIDDATLHHRIQDNAAQSISSLTADVGRLVDDLNSWNDRLYHECGTLQASLITTV